MKAAIVEAPGKAPVYADFAEPVAVVGETIVTVTASSLSNLARGRAAGTHYSAGSEFPFVVGVDGVGRLADGKRVYFLLPRTPFGAMAERTVVPTGQIITLPDDVDDARAAVIANAGMASWAALTERAHIQPGDTVLVNGATGASGTLAVKIARHLGAGRIIATGRNRAVLESLGADAIVPLGGDAETIDKAFRAHFAGRVDIVLDFLWGDSARSLLGAIARTVHDDAPLRYVQIGSISGGEIAVPASVLRSTGLQLMGSGLGSVSFERLTAAIAGVFEAAVPAGLELPYALFPLTDVATAWPRDDSAGRTVFTTAAS